MARPFNPVLNPAFEFVAAVRSARVSLHLLLPSVSHMPLPPVALFFARSRVARRRELWVGYGKFEAPEIVTRTKRGQ